MKGIKTVALITFKEGIRDRVYLIFLFFAVILLLFSLFLGMLVIGDPTKIIADFGMAVMSLFALLIVVFVGGTSFAREIQKKTVILVLSKPVSREEFMLGKIIGVWFNVFLNIIAMGTLLFLLLLLKGAKMWEIFVHVFLLTLEMGILTSVALMFSSFTTQFLSMLFTFSVYIVGHLATTIEKASMTLKSGVSRTVVKAVSYAIPNFDYFNLKNQIVYGIKVPSIFFYKSTGYFLLLFTFFTIIAMWVFKKREV